VRATSRIRKFTPFLSDRAVSQACVALTHTVVRIKMAKSGHRICERNG
jgi:hypothetical protein